MALSDNILSYYKLSNGAYSTDSAGANTLTTTGSAQQSGGFIDYGGSGDYVRATTNFGLTGTSDISISWWAKMTVDIAATGVGFLFQGSTLTTDRLIALDYEYNGGTRRLNLYNSNNSISASYNTSLGTTWHHIVITRTSGAIDLWLDGTKVISAAAQSTATGGQNVLGIGTGKSFGGTANYYYDEIGVWSRALTSGEVASLYNAGAGNQYPFIVDIPFSISETLALSETTTNLRARLFSAAETLSLSETISALKGISFSIAETLGLIEAYQYSRTYAFSIAESLGIVEVLIEIKKKWNNATKTVSIWTNSSKNTSDWNNEVKN